jgi:HlyD family secretion protein
MKTTTRTAALILASAVASAGATLVLARPAADGHAVAAGSDALPAAPPRATGTVVGPGRVEPVSEEIVVGGEIAGRLRAVRVQEGDRVAAGQVLAEIEPAEYRARLDAARATLAIARAEKARLVNGARAEERGEARAAALQASEVARQAEAERRRRETLFAEGAIPREELERAVRDERVAVARHDEQAEHARVVDAAARTDELARARAAVALAEAQVAEADALLAKTLVRAPCDGVVLRRHRQPGENLALLPSPTPIVTVADVSALRVRVDVDETEIAGLRTGLPAWVTADAYGAQRFPGHVIRVGEMLGRTHIRTDQPSERIDHKVLEVLVELDPGARLPVGLRVDAFIARP